MNIYFEEIDAFLEKTNQLAQKHNVSIEQVLKCTEIAGRLVIVHKMDELVGMVKNFLVKLTPPDSAGFEFEVKGGGFDGKFEGPIEK